MSRLFLGASLLLLSWSQASAAAKVTLESLLKQMTDLSGLAEFPDPPYVTKQFSSYDRASVTPDDPTGWFANADYAFMLYDGEVIEKTPLFQGRADAGPRSGRTFRGGDEGRHRAES